MNGEAFPGKISEFALSAVEAGYQYGRYALAVGASALTLTGVHATLHTPIAKAECVLDVNNADAYADCVIQESGGSNTGSNEQTGSEESAPSTTEETEEVEETEDTTEETEAAPAPSKPSESKKPPKKNKKPKVTLKKKKSPAETNPNIDYRTGRLKYSINQGDEPWGSMEYRPGSNSGQTNRSSACMDAAYTMTAVGLGKDTNFLRIAREFRQFHTAHGGDHRMPLYAGRKHGLETHYVGRNMEAVKKVLKKGGLAMALVNEGRFTGNGHFIVLSYDREQRGIRVTDPNAANDHKEGVYSAKYLMAESGGHVVKLWTFNTKRSSRTR